MDLTWKTNFFEGYSWFQFNNLGLALGMALKFYISVAKGLKLKARKFWGLILRFVNIPPALLLYSVTPGIVLDEELCTVMYSYVQQLKKVIEVCHSQYSPDTVIYSLPITVIILFNFFQKLELWKYLFRTALTL